MIYSKSEERQAALGRVAEAVVDRWDGTTYRRVLPEPGDVKL
jgi:hypothetical protein